MTNEVNFCNSKLAVTNDIDPKYLHKYKAYRYTLVVKDINDYKRYNKDELNQKRIDIVKKIFSKLTVQPPITKDNVCNLGDNSYVFIDNIKPLNDDLFKIDYHCLSEINMYIIKYNKSIYISLSRQIILINIDTKKIPNMINLIKKYYNLISEDDNLFSLDINAIVDEEIFKNKILTCTNIKEFTLDLRGPNLFGFSDDMKDIEDIYKETGYTDTKISYKNDSGHLHISDYFLSLIEKWLKTVFCGLGKIDIKSQSEIISSNDFAKTAHIKKSSKPDEIEDEFSKVDNNEEGRNEEYAKET